MGGALPSSQYLEGKTKLISPVAAELSTGVVIAIFSFAELEPKM